VASAFWRAARGRFVPPVGETALPYRLLERFSGSLAEQVRATLAFLSPLTTGAAIGRGSAGR